MCRGQIRTDPKHICFTFIRVADISSTLEDFFTKDRTAPKVKQVRYKYRKDLDLGKQIGARKIWRRSRTPKSFKSGIENTSGGIKAGGNDQPEQPSNAQNGINDDNEVENFGDGRHCKILTWVSANSNERQSQTKTTLYISQDQERHAKKWTKC